MVRDTTKGEVKILPQVSLVGGPQGQEISHGRHLSMSSFKAHLDP